MIISQAPLSDPSVTITVAIIAASAALIGALIAAITAGRRQKRELTHNRELADVSELREVLDEAAVSITQAERAIHSAVKRQGSAGDPLKEKLNEAQVALSNSNQRIKIRLGPSQINLAYDDTLKAYTKIQELILRPPSGNSSEELEASRLSFAQCRDAFLGTANHLVQSRIVGKRSFFTRLRHPQKR